MMKMIQLVASLLIFTQLYAQEKTPERIISLSPQMTENLYLLGVESKLIADTIYCVRPDEAKKKEKIGDISNANIEKIISLKPDLVVAIELSNPRQIQQLCDLGVAVVVYPQPESFEEICGQFLDLGSRVGKGDFAQDMIMKLKSEVRAVTQRITGLAKPKVFVQIGVKPLFTTSKDSFINDYIRFAGGENIAANSATGIYSREKVLQANPDVIVIVTMGLAAEKEKEEWKEFSTITAVKNNRIHILDSYKVCAPTPETFLEILHSLTEIFHPTESVHENLTP